MSISKVDILLCQPKYETNVAGVVRAMACFCADDLYLLNKRYEPSSHKPREFRLYNPSIMEVRKPVSAAIERGLTPVCVELLEGAENMIAFEHPRDVLYVFGPENGEVPQVLRRLCHKFVQIPSLHCLNLAASVYVTLYDRLAKEMK